MYSGRLVLVLVGVCVLRGAKTPLAFRSICWVLGLVPSARHFILVHICAAIASVRARVARGYRVHSIVVFWLLSGDSWVDIPSFDLEIEYFLRPRRIDPADRI